MLSLRGKLAASTAAPARLRFRAALLFGYDSNANGGLAVNSIVLTPPEGSIELPVDQAFLPRPSNLWLGSVDATGRWQTGWGPVEARLRLSGKRYSSEPNYDTNDVAVTVAGSIANSDQAFWVAEWRRLNMGSSLLVLDIPRLWAVRDLPVEVAGFQPSLGVEFEGRRYQDALSIYDARILWLVAGVRRTLWGGFLNGMVRLGDDRGPADRPGGDAARVELAALWQGSVAQDLELSASLVLARTRDDDGYSPLIEDGARRVVGRSTARAELAWRLRDGWYALAWAERTRQVSNIDLFELRQTVVMTGLRYQLN
jgi:hypothetical protein